MYSATVANAAPCTRLHMHVVLAVPLAPLQVAHAQRVLDGLGHVTDIPGVDQDGPGAQGLRSSCDTQGSQEIQGLCGWQRLNALKAKSRK